MAIAKPNISPSKLRLVVKPLNHPSESPDFLGAFPMPIEATLQPSQPTPVIKCGGIQNSEIGLLLVFFISLLFS